MPKNGQGAVDEFLGNLNDSQGDVFNQEPEDIFPGVEEGKTGEITEGAKDEKPLPFNKDPKVQKFIDKKVAQALEKAAPLKSATETFVRDTATDEDEISEVLTRIIGNDSPEKISAIKDFKKVLSGLEEKGAKKALAQLQQQAEARQTAERQAQEQLDTYFEDIEDTFSVDITSNAPQARKTRAEFVDFVRRISPKNKDGEVTEFPDLVEVFKVFQETKKTEKPANRAKELAARGMSRSSDASSAPVTSDKSWAAVDKLFSKFG